VAVKAPTKTSVRAGSIDVAVEFVPGMLMPPSSALAVVGGARVRHCDIWWRKTLSNRRR